MLLYSDSIEFSNLIDEPAFGGHQSGCRAFLHVTVWDRKSRFSPLSSSNECDKKRSFEFRIEIKTRRCSCLTILLSTYSTMSISTPAILTPTTNSPNPNMYEIDHSTLASKCLCKQCATMETRYPCKEEILDGQRHPKISNYKATWR